MKTTRMEETKVEETIDVKTTNGNISETIDITTIETTPKATQRQRENKQVIEETVILETDSKQHHRHHHHHHHQHQKKNGEVIEEILIEETESTKRHHHKHHHHHHHEEFKEVIEETIPAPPQTSPPFLTPTEDLDAEVIWKPQAYWAPPQLPAAPTSPEPSTTSTDELAGVAWQAEFNLNNPEAVESTPSTTSSSPTGLDQRPLSKVGETVQMLESIQATILPPKPLMKSWLNFSNSRPSLMLQTQVIEETEEITPVSSPGIEEEDRKVKEDLTKVEQTVKILDELEESLQSTMPPSPPPGWLDDSEEDEEDILEISSIPVVQQGISSPSPTPSPPAQGLGQQEFHSRQNQLLHLLIPRPKLEQKELVLETEEVEESLESSTPQTSPTRQNPPSSQLEIVQTEFIEESSQSTSPAGPNQVQMVSSTVQMGLNLEGPPTAPAGIVQTGLNSEGPPTAPVGSVQMGLNSKGPPTAPAVSVQMVPNIPNSTVQMGLTLEGPPTAPTGIVETELIVESLETTPTPTPPPSPATQRTMKTELQLPLTRPTSANATGPNLEIEQTQLIVESLESTPTSTPTPTPPPSPTSQRILKAGLNLPLTSLNSTKQMEQTELIVESLESTPTPTPPASPVRSLPPPLPFPLPIPLSTEPQTSPLEVVQTELIVNRTPPSSQSLQQAEFIAELKSLVQPPSPSPTVEVVETVYVEDSSTAQPTVEVVETEIIVTSEQPAPVLVGELALDSSDKLGKRYSVSAALAESALEQPQPQQPEVQEKRKICCNCRCIIA